MDAARYANKRSEKEGLTLRYIFSGDGAFSGIDYKATGYHLLTEAQGQFIMRGGGEALIYIADGQTLETMAWYRTNSGSRTHPVDSSPPTPAGVCGVAGNVYE